jgi:hypothetical protein
VSVNVISNIMRIHCLLMIGSVLSNDFPLILIIIRNELRLWGLNSLDMRGNGIRTYTTKWILKSRTISDGCYMGCAQSALLLSPSLLLEYYLLNGRWYGDRTFTIKCNALSPTLGPISRMCRFAGRMTQGLSALPTSPSRRLHWGADSAFRMKTLLSWQFYKLRI